MSSKSPNIVKTKSGFAIHFSAMASECCVLLENAKEELADHIAEISYAEAIRIEQKYSRYVKGNLIYQINNAAGSAVIVDEETVRLLEYAQTLYELSSGVFDITSGVLRRIWVFDQSDDVPKRSAAKALLNSVGWHRVSWHPPTIQLMKDMQIDFGGIGKEYAVDLVAQKIKAITNTPVLINFGGDIYSTRAPQGGAWTIGIKTRSEKPLSVKLGKGGLATSGDANRFLLRNGKRYSHILNARTGWPISQAPNSVTVAAQTCCDAGMLATLTITKGKDAEHFAASENLICWIER